MAATPEAVESWVLAVAPRAVAYARTLLRQPEDAEDIVQDCLCRLLARSAYYDLPRDGTKLLYRSITNACINWKTRRRSVLRLFRTAEDGETDLPDDPADPAAASPEQHAMGRELQQAIATALRQLPPLQRAAIELKSLGHTQQEIAEILQITASHAGVLIHRARAELEKTLSPFLGGETVP